MQHFRVLSGVGGPLGKRKRTLLSPEKMERKRVESKYAHFSYYSLWQSLTVLLAYAFPPSRFLLWKRQPLFHSLGLRRRRSSSTTAAGDIKNNYPSPTTAGGQTRQQPSASAQLSSPHKNTTLQSISHIYVYMTKYYDFSIPCFLFLKKPNLFYASH